MSELFPQISKTAHISVRDLTMSRGGNELFVGLSAKISAGDILWIQGDNGIGKTTLLGALAGLHRQDSGDLSWHYGDTDCQAGNIVSYQPHRSYAKAKLTTHEDITFWAEIYKNSSLIQTSLTHVGLAEKSAVPTERLSAGQRRRLGLAKLIISQKPIWIMDEPSAAMDKDGTALIDRLVIAHIKRGGAAIIASHGQPRALSGNTRKLVLQATT